MNEEQKATALRVQQSLVVQQYLARIEITAMRNVVFAKILVEGALGVPRTLESFALSLSMAHLNFFEKILAEVKERIVEHAEYHRQLVRDHESSLRP